MKSPYKKKPIIRHRPRPFKKMIQNSQVDQSQPMDVDNNDNNDNNKMDVDSDNDNNKMDVDSDNNNKMDID
jgi:hypothetical protein